MKIAILVQSGFGTRPDSTSGLWPLVCALRKQFPDARVEFMAHDDPVEALADEVAHYDWIGHQGHSFGIGHGYLRFARRLALRRRMVDFCAAIDPVPDIVGRWFERTEDPFPYFPDNTGEVLAFRTKFKPDYFYPWGRRVDHPGVIQQIVFGPGADEINEPDVHHDTIDASGFVHAAILEKLRERIGP
jgi:hypothetical protein